MCHEKKNPITKSQTLMLQRPIICIHSSMLSGLNQNYRDRCHLCHRCPPSRSGTTASAASLPTTTPDSIHVEMRTTQRLFIDFTIKIISFISLELTGNRICLEKIWGHWSNVPFSVNLFMMTSTHITD